MDEFKTKIIIPARNGSKGLVHKNRILFDYTFNIIPTKYKKNVILTTDDDFFIKKYDEKEYGITIHNRPKHLAEDDTSIKDVLLNLVDAYNITKDEIFIMLYLTYPERTWGKIVEAFNFFIEKNASSLLCKKDIKGSHPYLMLFEKENNKGEQLVKHNLYRRQTYPKIFELSHYIFICKVSEIENLNNNLYNDNTIFFPITEKIDIDTLMDLEKFKKKNGEICS